MPTHEQYIKYKKYYTDYTKRNRKWRQKYNRNKGQKIKKLIIF